MAQDVGGGPGVEDPDDVSAAVTDEAGGGIPQVPPQSFGLGVGPPPGEAEQGKPSGQAVGHGHQGQPCLIRSEGGEGEPVTTTVLDPGDHILDMSVGSHVPVPLDGVTVGCVGVVTPVPKAGGREQGLLSAGVQRFASDDEPGPLGPTSEVELACEFSDLGPFAFAAVLTDRRRPTVILADDAGDRGVDLGVGSGNEGEPDVPFPALGGQTDTSSGIRADPPVIVGRLRFR